MKTVTLGFLTATTFVMLADPVNAQIAVAPRHAQQYLRGDGIDLMSMSSLSMPLSLSMQSVLAGIAYQEYIDITSDGTLEYEARPSSGKAGKAGYDDSGSKAAKAEDLSTKAAKAEDLSTKASKFFKPDDKSMVDLNPPVCTELSGEGVVDFDAGANDTESGIASVTLVYGAENLDLTVNSFSVGDQTVTFKATRQNDTMPASGTILVADRVGSNCTLDVALEPFDFEIFAEQTRFPALLHRDLFGTPSAEESPIYTTAELLPEAPGMYPASTNEDGTSFFIQISSIVIPSTEVVAAVLENATQDLVDAFAIENFSSFAFRGFFHFGGASVAVVALVYTLLTTSNVVVIYDPTDDFGITDETDEIEFEPFEFSPTFLPSGAGRRLQEETAVPLLEQSSALVPHGRVLQSQSCANALSEAIDAANCESPEQPSVNQACVSTASFAFNQAIAAARGDYDTVIQVAKTVYYAVMIELNRRKIRDFAKSLIPCVLVGLLSGPLGYALCAARALAIAILKVMALQLAAKAALELAKRNAELVLRAALYAACQAFRGALYACVSCVECGNPEQQPCGDACYDPATQKCCPEEAILAKDACCPDEKSCPGGSCIPQDSCCPEEKPCDGSCIPKKDCCDPSTSRKLLRRFKESAISHRNLEEDPCCTDPNDPCCGSDNECCGSDDPCCGSDDPCCGSNDPCCGSNDSCCGQSDCGGSSGDPHMTTFDGLRYDCQGRGEFVLVAAGDAMVQARFKKVGSVAVTSGVAVTEGPSSTKVEISIGVVDSGGGPALVINGAVISPPSLGYEDSRVIVLSTTGSNSGPFRITYKSSALSVFVRYNTGFGRYLNLNVGLPQVLRDVGTVGLLGSADNDPTNDWIMANGTLVPIPYSRSDRVGLQSLNYCLDNWCVDEEASSLFTYYEHNYNFSFFSGCNDLVRDVVDISTAPPEAVAFCGVDEACLVDFIEGGREVAQETLFEMAKLDAVFTTGSLVANPATVPVDQSINVDLSIDTTTINLGIEEFALYGVDSLTGEQIGAGKVLILVDGNNDGVFTGSINVFSAEAGETFGFRAVPVIGGAEDPTSPAAILRLVTVRSFSEESGITDTGNDHGCPGPCDDENPCTIDFCLNSVCRTKSMACGIGQSCDPFSGRCQDIESLVPCVAVIDEWNNRAYDSEWATFRERFPQRPFCLLVPNANIQALPNGFAADMVNNPDGIDRTIASVVNRDNGNAALASNWTSICGLDSLTPDNVQFVGLFVDTSGSMTLSTVGTSLPNFEADMTAQGIEIRRVYNGREKYIDPFLTDLVPVA